MELQNLFETVAGFFEKQNLEYAIIGGFALYGFGYVRATQDIDFVTRLRNQGAVTTYLESIGFSTTHRSSAFSNHIHPIGTMQIDIMYVQGKTADEIFSCVQRRMIFENKEYPVVSPEHLIAMKLFAAANNSDRKYKDLSDVQEIIKRADVNMSEVKKTFEKYGFQELFNEIARQK